MARGKKRAAGGCLRPFAALAVLLAFSFWNGRAVADHTERWMEQLDAAEASVRTGDWDAAADTLSAGLEDWGKSRTWLHIVAWHSAVDGAEDLYRRCLLYAEEREKGELLTALSDLRDQFRLLAEMEGCALGNIL